MGLDLKIHGARIHRLIIIWSIWNNYIVSQWKTSCSDISKYCFVIAYHGLPHLWMMVKHHPFTIVSCEFYIVLPWFPQNSIGLPYRFPCFPHFCPALPHRRAWWTKNNRRLHRQRLAALSWGSLVDVEQIGRFGWENVGKLWERLLFYEKIWDHRNQLMWT